MSYFDISDAEGVELDGDRDDDECPFDDESTVVSEPDPWTLAAMSGEGGDMRPVEDQMQQDAAMDERNEDPRSMVGSREAAAFVELIEGANDLQLKQMRYALDREEKRRIEAAKATIRAFDPAAPKPRATRKDAGIKRSEYKAQKGAA